MTPVKKAQAIREKKNTWGKKNKKTSRLLCEQIKHDCNRLS